MVFSRKTNTGELVRLSRNINDKRPIIIAEKVNEIAKASNMKNIGILGVAYKPNVDDCRETSAEPIFEHLKAQGYNVRYHEPHVNSWHCERIKALNDMNEWADMQVLITAHDEYKSIKKSGCIFDACGLLK